MATALVIEANRLRLKVEGLAVVGQEAGLRSMQELD